MPTSKNQRLNEIRRASVKDAVESRCASAGHVATQYDSVVIVGDEGLTTSTFAARLARDPRFADRVTIVGQPLKQDPRLLAGVSLRGRAMDYLLYALDTDLETLVDVVAPGRMPMTIRQTAAAVTLQQNGTYTFSKPATWQNRTRRSTRPLLFGFRNSALAGAITTLSAPVTITAGNPTSVSEARRFAQGGNPLIVDATKRGVLLDRDAGSGWGIAAAQVPFRKVANGGPMDDQTTFAPIMKRDGRINTGYFMPFADPLSPSADRYGIVARPVRFVEEMSDKTRQLNLLQNELLGIGAAGGLEPVDLDNTIGLAWVPAPSTRAPSRSQNRVFDLRRAVTPGVGAYYADGMTGAAIAGVSAAEAILVGRDPVAVSNAALARFRRWNAVWRVETTRMATVVEKGVKHAPLVALAWPHSSSVNDWMSHS